MEKAYAKWVQGIHRPTGGLAEFKRFIRQQRSNTVKRLQRERYDEGKQFAGSDLMFFLKKSSTSSRVVNHSWRILMKLKH